jgi:hypothetical protein
VLYIGVVYTSSDFIGPACKIDLIELYLSFDFIGLAYKIETVCSVFNLTYLVGEIIFDLLDCFSLVKVRGFKSWTIRNSKRLLAPISISYSLLKRALARSFVFPRIYTIEKLYLNNIKD